MFKVEIICIAGIFRRRYLSNSLQSPEYSSSCYLYLAVHKIERECGIQSLSLNEYSKSCFSLCIGQLVFNRFPIKVLYCECRQSTEIGNFIISKLSFLMLSWNQQQRIFLNECTLKGHVFIYFSPKLLLAWHKISDNISDFQLIWSLETTKLSNWATT